MPDTLTPATPPSTQLRLGNWEALRADATPIRFEVFVDEQGVPPEIELDDMDPLCLHAVAYDAHGIALGTGRLLPDGHIGRMAVLRPARGTGLGGLLLEALVDAGLRQGHTTLVLHAQCHARPFYERHGFQAEGAPFQEAGIDHIAMVRRAR
ncbi:GNAT family N-acetyltransferase [Kerstersia gyiorum]|uniref:GNAT family N-acetyltransferase n=1 Tax=Kerstersia gyiorum TaxID=206506 RepID=UPI003B42F34B